jgi:large subunit ribosomal protein L6
MSRIGKLPIPIPEGVEVTVDKNNVVTVKGKLGTLQQKVHPDITVEIDKENKQIHVKRPSDATHHKSMHGLYRSLINNMVKGVSEGFKVQLELVGVGYKASVNGQLLDMNLGFSHNILMEIAPEVKVEVQQERRGNPIVTLTSFDKQLLGQVAAKIRSFRPPEPYKGKGIRFVGEEIRRKQGKSGAA